MDVGTVGRAASPGRGEETADDGWRGCAWMRSQMLELGRDTGVLVVVGGGGRGEGGPYPHRRLVRIWEPSASRAFAHACVKAAFVD